MLRYDVIKKAEKEYGHCRLRYKLQHGDDTYYELNRKNYKKMKKALKDVGICIDVSDGELNISIDSENYIRTKERNAGRKKSMALKQEEKKKGRIEPYRYADIVLMSQTMKDQQVADKIGMPIATYYRHKKSMKESDYYQSLDKDRLGDKEYLESVHGNYSF